MLPSSTVENYLKAIYVGETHLVGGQKLVPMGQLAVALGIAPGTATTMVKALAESGLVTYEPYNGVRLTGAGEVARRRAAHAGTSISASRQSWATIDASREARRGSSEATGGNATRRGSRVRRNSSTSSMK